jgi:iron complex transport system substrate-binding protein
MVRGASFRVASGIAAAALLAAGAAAAAGPGHARPAAVQPPAAPKPMRIMSLNQCTDLLLLQLVPRSRIASLSYLGHDAVDTLFPGADTGLQVNQGTAEDVLNQQPDLILAGEFTTPVTKRLAAQALHTPLVEVRSADSFADIRATVRQVGAAVGEPARAEALIRQMDATLARIAATPLPRRMRVVAWSGGSWVPGKGTLTNDIIETAGAVNIAALPGANDSGFDVEQLLAANPDALLYGGGRSGPPSLQADEGQHPLVRALFGDRRIDFNDVAHSCGLPQSADSALAIHRALLAIANRRRPS